MEDKAAYASFCRRHWCKLRQKNPPEWINQGFRLRNEVFGVDPND